MTAPAPELPGLRFERVLGSGGYADVYLYRQQLPERLVAVKVLKDARLSDAQRRQFTAEANAMAGLADHPHIVPVFSAAVSPDGRPYIMMMYYAAANLAVRAASERLPVAEVLRIGIQIASAVETAHRAGILHRDIKPANLLVSQYGAPGLTDFGVAGQVAALEDDVELGVSVPWAAPEVLYATAPTSVASDVYSLAAALWHLLVGRSPFEEPDGDNTPFTLMRRVRDVPPPPTGRPDVPDSLDRLLRQAMAKDPAARTATAIDLARGLQAVEQELQLPRTEIVVTAERTPYSPSQSRPADLLGADTVARPVISSTQPPLPRPDVLPTRAVPPTTAPVAGGPPTTTGRPLPLDTQPPAFDDPAEPEPPRPSRTPLLLAAVVLVLGVAVVAGFVIFSSGSKSPAAARSTLPAAPGTQNAGNPGADVAPGVPQITAKRNGKGAVMYHWTYSAREPGDTYQWREVGSDRHGVVDKPRVTLPGSRTGAHCIQVRVVRADGSNAATSFSPPGCAG